MDGILLANTNYANNGFVYTPVEMVVNQPQVKYNQAHMRTYAVGDAINLWKRRFQCLQTLLNHKEGKNDIAIRAINDADLCATHNVLIQCFFSL